MNPFDAMLGWNHRGLDLHAGALDAWDTTPTSNSRAAIVMTGRHGSIKAGFRRIPPTQRLSQLNLKQLFNTLVYIEFVPAIHPRNPPEI